ncbi:MAG: hypothetical protein K2O04_07565 [Clostridiales bacterium]|nr:hypothetical protein [Clostridiales bacterium]
MTKKKLNIISIVFMALILVGLVLVIVGMCTGVVSAEGESTTLFDDGWDMPGMPSTTFTVVAFIVAIIGAVALIVNSALGLLGKDIKILGLAGGAVAVVGAVLVLVAGLVLAGDLSDIINSLSNLGSSIGVEVPKVSVSAGVGIWLGFIGGLVAGASGILSALKIGSKE